MIPRLETLPQCPVITGSPKMLPRELSGTDVPELTRKDVIFVLATTLCLYSLLRMLQRLVFSPFKGIPGPLLAKLTDKWIFFVELSGYRSRTVHRLHVKYGPVVQLSPNELSFCSVQAVNDIYGVGTRCIKAPSYEFYGRPGMFQTRDPEKHRQRQKKVAHIFSQANMTQAEPLIQDLIITVVSIIAQNVEKSFNALHWCRMTALDVSGDVLLGKSFDGLKGNGEAPTYINKVDNAFLVWALQENMPWIARILSILPLKGVKEFINSGEYIYEYGDERLKEYIKLHGRDAKRRDMLTKIIRGNPETNEEPLSDYQIGIEISNFTFAATDTTGNTMAYALYRLSAQPYWQNLLRKELRSHKVRDQDYSYQALQDLPMLNGITYETLRLHPGAPSALPRITPPEGCKIEGRYIPGNTLVSMQSLTTQLDPDHYQNPYFFYPSRWVNANGGTPGMKERIMVFGKGSRACLGRSMALMEIKIFLARVIDRFEVKLADESTHDDMEMTDHFVLIPKGHKCQLIFTEAA